MAPVLGSGGHGDHPQHFCPQDVYSGNVLQHIKEKNEYYPTCCLLLSKIQNLDKRYWKSFFKTFNLFLLTLRKLFVFNMIHFERFPYQIFKIIYFSLRCYELNTDEYCPSLQERQALVSSVNVMIWSVKCPLMT